MKKEIEVKVKVLVDIDNTKVEDSQIEAGLNVFLDDYQNHIEDNLNFYQGAFTIVLLRPPVIGFVE